MLHVVVGLILLVFGVFGVISWWGEFGLVLRGLIPFLFVLGGLVALGSGLSKANQENSEDNKEETE